MTTCVLLSLLLAAQTDTAVINRYVLAELERQRIPGLSLAVLAGDRVLISRGYGFANVELRVPATDSTVYQSGSMGKQFTAALVEMLVDNHLLRLDDSIVRWFPEGARVWQGITVRHLLTHTAGVAEYTDSTFDYRKDYTEDELVKFAASRPLDFRPGERWSYSNTGYVLLGALIHRVTGRFYGDLLRDSVFRPLGMNDSRVISEADIVPNRAAGYRLEGGVLKNQEWVAPSLNTTADGALYFTVRDLTRWAIALIARYPESGLTVIVLANLAQAQVSAVAFGIAGMLDTALAAPHLVTWRSPQPPMPVAALLHAIATRPDSAPITPRFRRFLTPDLQSYYGGVTAGDRQWIFAGCDAVGRRRISYLGTPIAYICHARAGRPGGRGGGTLVSVLYSADWRAAGVEGYGY